VTTTALTALVALLLGYGATRAILDRADRIYCVGSLRGSLARLVRSMENNPRTMPARLKESRMNTLTAIKEWDIGQYPVPYVAQKIPKPPDRLLQAKEVAEWNERSASEFWKNAQAIRDLCLVFLILFRDKNLIGAAQSVTDRMPDAALLGDVLHQPMRRRRRRILKGILQTPEVIFRGLEYAPFDEENVTYPGTTILEGMRKYAR
jgi:hypothetical protein